MLDYRAMLVDLVNASKDKGIVPFRAYLTVGSVSTAQSQDGALLPSSLNQPSLSLTLTGIVNGKLKTLSVDAFDGKDNEGLLTKLLAVKDQGDYSPEWFAKPGLRVGKANSYSAKLAALPFAVAEKVASKIDAGIRANGALISSSLGKVTVTNAVSYLVSSDGLDLSYKANGFAIEGKAIAKKGKAVSQWEDGQVFHGALDKLDAPAFGTEIGQKAIAFLTVGKAKAGKCLAFFSPRVASQLLYLGVSHLSGDKVAAHDSSYDGKIGTIAFSSLLTILNDPFIASGYAKPFDCEGTPTEKFMAIDHGKLRCLFLDNRYAASLGLKSNGCQEMDEVNPQYLVVTPSDKSFRAMLSEVKDGVSIEWVPDLKESVGDDLSVKGTFLGHAIENGKLTDPIKGVFSGKIDSMLLTLSSISREREDRDKALCPWFEIPDVAIASK